MGILFTTTSELDVNCLRFFRIVSERERPRFFRLVSERERERFFCLVSERERERERPRFFRLVSGRERDLIYSIGNIVTQSPTLRMSPHRFDMMVSFSNQYVNPLESLISTNACANDDEIF